MKNRARVGCAILLAVVALAAGCAEAPDSAREPELVWAVGGNGPDGAGPPAALAIRDLWNEQHPDGPTLRLVPLPDTADDQYQLMATELNAGLGELDILELDVIWTAEFAQNDWLVDLADLRQEIERVSLPFTVETTVWDGRLWAAPYTTDAGLLYYRSDLVADGPPKTWEELKRVGHEIGEREGIAPFVADGTQYEGMVVQYLEYLWGAGGELLDSDGRSVLFEEAPALRAANFMRDAYREGLYAPGFNSMKLDDARKTFQAGDAVFMRSWPSAYRQMTGNPPLDPDSQVNGLVGIAPLPTFAGSDPVTALGGHNLAVSRFSDDVSAATEFVRFVSTSEDVQRILADHSLAPTRQATYDDMRGDPLMDLLAAVLPTAMPRPAIPEWTTISEEMQQQIFAAYTGSPDPKPRIEAIRGFLDATLKDR